MPAKVMKSSYDFMTENAALRRELATMRKRERDRKRVRPKPIPVWAVESALSLPEWMHETATEIVTDPSMRENVKHVMERGIEFRSFQTSALVAIGMDRNARNFFDRMLDKHWGSFEVPASNQNYLYNEVVIGAGLHAAIFCATRVRMGK